jgi:tRNA (guanosine-2'-O-)-methyltransferase
MTPKREARMRDVAQARQAGLCVVLEDIHDPHNAAAILRTCDAFGIQDVRLVFVEEKSFNPRQVGKSSSSSANRWLSFTKYASSEDCAAALKAEGYVIAATALAARGTDPYATDLTHEKLALVVGNEHRGVSEAMLSAADRVLTIPMRGFVESLNVSVAAALCIAEIVRQRGSRPLAAEVQSALLSDWLKR